MTDPVVNVRVETDDGIGASYLSPLRVEHEDDGSLTVILKASQYPFQPAMTDPVRAKLSERMEASADSAVLREGQPADLPTQVFFLRETMRAHALDVAALEARLAAAEGLPERWRRDSEPSALDDYEDRAADAARRFCADELSAILKGEGESAAQDSSSTNFAFKNADELSAILKGEG